MAKRAANEAGTDLARAKVLLLEASAVVPHTDADGLAAGAIALRARGESADRAVLLGRGVNPFTHPHLVPGPLPAILDWGIRSFDRPALFADHHAPEAEPRDDQLLVSGFGEPKGVSTSVLMRRIVPDAPAWLAAVGAVGDYGDAGLAQPECAGAAKTAVRKLVPLINAPRRCPDGPAVRTALAILVEHDDPREALKDPRIAELEEAKRAWRAAFDAAVRTRRRCSATTSPSSDLRAAYQVHPLAPQTWSCRPRQLRGDRGERRLPAGPGELRDAVRAPQGRRPPRLRCLARRRRAERTRCCRTPPATARARGHAGATGGSVTPAEFERLMKAMGQ